MQSIFLLYGSEWLEVSFQLAGIAFTAIVLCS